MTEEEKKQRLAELRERMAAKKAAKAKEEAKDNLANEAIRRKAGKVRPYAHLPRPYCQHVAAVRVPT